MASFVGVDVSKATLDVAVYQGVGWSTANSVTRIAALLTRLAALDDPLVVCESTGGGKRRWLPPCTRRVSRWR